jgi:hypothetical protein
MISLPTPYAAAQIAEFLDDHLSWSAWWDKRYGLWRVAEDDPGSDLYAESPDADVVIRYMQAHGRHEAQSDCSPGSLRPRGPELQGRPAAAPVARGDTPGTRTI